MSLIPKSFLPPRPRPPAGDNHTNDAHAEFSAQRIVYNALKALAPDARKRVLDYILAKIAAEEKPRETTDGT